MLSKIYNGLFNNNNNGSNKNNNESNKNNTVYKNDDIVNKNDNKKKMPTESDMNSLNILINSCINLYDPDVNNYEIIMTKFNTEYPSFFSCEDFLKHKCIVVDKLTEKKNILFNKTKSLEYYCICMLTNEIIKISKTNNLLKFINKNNKNILYCIEYINVEQLSIDEIVEKYSKLYKCKIQM
jgi:hypothetical protein